MREIIHWLFHGGGLAALLYQVYKRKQEGSINITINFKTDMKNILTYLQKNWIHISASLGALITVAYNYFSTKQFTYIDLTMILGALGLMSTTNSGTTNPPAAGKIPVVLLLGFLMLGCNTTTKAQANSLIQMNGSKWLLKGDTIINTGTAYDTVLMSNAFAAGAVVTYITKVSGTVSPTVVIQGSVDGKAWTTFGQDTLVLSNASGTTAYTWQLPGLPQKSKQAASTQVIMTPAVLPYLYYRVLATGTGTMAAIIKSWISPR